MAPKITRVRFYALLYGILGVAFVGFTVSYTLEGETLAGGVFAVFAVGEFLLAAWYASNPGGIERPTDPAPSSRYEYVLITVALVLLAWAGRLLYSLVG